MPDIKVVDEKGAEVKHEQVVPNQPDVVAVDGTPYVESSIGELFGLTQSEQRMFKSKINTLIDYAKTQTDDHSPEGIKWALRHLELKLGTPPLGERRITFLTRYATLSLEKKKIEKELDNYVS